jgi:protein O-GlcNAc transferase
MEAPPPTEALRAALHAHRHGRLADAEHTYRRVLNDEPANSEALQLLGALCIQTGRCEEAIGLLRRALHVRPGASEILNNLGIAYEGAGHLPDAEATYRSALRSRPGFVDALNNLGNTLKKLGRLREAEQAHRDALRHRPAHAVTHAALGGVALDQGDLDAALKYYWRAASLRPNDAAAHSDLLFWLLHHPRYTARQLFDAHRTWDQRHARPLAGNTRPPDNDRTADRPLRVGYVSPDFREHTVARFFEPLLANHDPRRVLPVCYSDVARPDDVTQRLRGCAAEWRDTAGLSHEALASLIRQDKIDVLVDLTGHMAGNRLLTFARRPAPVQVTYLGYPHTTGLDGMDCRLTDAESDPPGAEHYHVEKLLRLPRCAWAYRPTESPHTTEPPAARNGFVTFGSLNRMAKISRPVATLWANVLQAVPNSRLMVLAVGGEDNPAVRRLFESVGIPPDRLRLAPTGGRNDYLKQCIEVDVALDPFPYNGMTTTCDLLWVGVPVVTLAGAEHRSRVGADLLDAVGLSDLVAASEEEFCRAAASLASDLSGLSALRRTLRQRVSDSPLRREAELARAVEGMLCDAWAEWARA